VLFLEGDDIVAAGSWDLVQQVCGDVMEQGDAYPNRLSSTKSGKSLWPATEELIQVL